MKIYYIVKERNILPTIKRRKDNWIGPVLHRNCLIKHIIEDRGKDINNEKTRKKA
jgi:hypothetical protein